MAPSGPALVKRTGARCPSTSADPASWNCRVPFQHFSPSFLLLQLVAGVKNLIPDVQDFKSSLFNYG